ncbi:N-acetyltransferase [Paenibacillus sp. UNC499MF]|uniref:N-acetyltransferase n=1 Tax=Paenibacillus sp. UNC499MF TaxID=1502751 RepID=UPI00089FBF99|nr:N-acetyltransferase [Paenibacillus sp. UNC499MF]SEF48376.1 amino-acid N-acetyltransferase [Paenibacillus sp. UNC499MF]
MTVACRRATEDDIEELVHIIQGYARQGIMLPRDREMVRRHLDTFVVAVDEDALIGCGSLTRLGENLVEIRSLGVSEDYKGQGVGTRLVDFLLEEARRLNITKVMALTYEVKFFQKNGFRIVPKHIFPEKVWTDCIHCKKQYCCDEIAVLRELD